MIVRPDVPLKMGDIFSSDATERSDNTAYVVTKVDDMRYALIKVTGGLKLRNRFTESYPLPILKRRMEESLEYFTHIGNNSKNSVEEPENDLNRKQELWQDRRDS